MEFGIIDRMNTERALCNLQPPEDYRFGCPDGWVYKDTPKALESVWREFLAVLGEGNYKLLSEATYKRDGVVLCRGQLMISPKGIANAEAFSGSRH